MSSIISNDTLKFKQVKQIYCYRKCCQEVFQSMKIDSNIENFTGIVSLLNLKFKHETFIYRELIYTSLRLFFIV